MLDQKMERCMMNREMGEWKIVDLMRCNSESFKQKIKGEK